MRGECTIVTTDDRYHGTRDYPAMSDAERFVRHSRLKKDIDYSGGAGSSSTGERGGGGARTERARKTIQAHHNHSSSVRLPGRLWGGTNGAERRSVIVVCNERPWSVWCLGACFFFREVAVGKAWRKHIRKGLHPTAEDCHGQRIASTFRTPG